MNDDGDPFTHAYYEEMMARLKVEDPELYAILEQQGRETLAAIECDELEIGPVAQARTQARLRKLMQERHGDGPWTIDARKD